MSDENGRRYDCLYKAVDGRDYRRASKAFSTYHKVKNNAINNFVYSGKFRQDDGVETITQCN